MSPARTPPLGRVLLAWLVAVALLMARARPAAAAPKDGWDNPDALALAKKGIEAKKSGDIPGCIAQDLASLAIEDHPYVRLHIASCYAAQKKYKDALINARTALAAAIRSDDEDLKKGALARVQDVMPRLGKLKIEVPPENSENLKVSLNGIPVRPNQIQDKLTVDPGDYIVEAIREDNGSRYLFKTTVHVGEGEEKTVEVLPKKDELSESVEQCLRDAKTYKERLKCIEEKEAHPAVHMGLNMSGYTDTTAVHVFSPSMNFAVDSPTGGWSFGGSFLIDFVTAASPDLVSTASSHYREQRYAGSLGGGYKFKFGTIGLSGNVSSEPDYLSRTLGGSFSTELSDKAIVPVFGYHYTWDSIGYRNSPFDDFEKSLTTHSVEAGVTFVLSPSTLLVTGIAMQFEAGENAKLYRFIPMFPTDIAGKIPAGASIDLVNENRLNFRPIENVPNHRDRFAIAARINHRFPSSTLRIEERLYDDDWGIKASTTDAQYFYDLTERLRVWPHFRIHAQTAATFYQIAYSAVTNTNGSPIEIPHYRTDDRELSPMAGLTFGGGSRIALTNEKSSTQLAIVVAGDVMYDKYFASLFITSRTAVFGTLGLDAEF